MKAAFQGLEGAYSEAALRAYFGPKAEAVGYAFSEQVFDAVESGAVDAGIVPVENSIAGPVGVNVDLLLERPVYAVGESYLRVSHCLLAPMGETLKSIKSARSHPVALAQCREFLIKHHIAAAPEFDTAGAAELVSLERKPGVAAIASKECAAAYKLDVLASDIQTVKGNFTRFLAFVKEGKAPKDSKPTKTSLAFVTAHKPGALLDALRRFADRGLNLSKLESRPIPSDPFSYVFFADVQAGAHEPAMRSALDELRKDAKRLKVIGSYPAAERPKN